MSQVKLLQILQAGKSNNSSRADPSDGGGKHHDYLSLVLESFVECLHCCIQVHQFAEAHVCNFHHGILKMLIIMIMNDE